MTEVYRDGLWQSVSEKGLTTLIAPAMDWIPCVARMADGSDLSALRCLVDGPHDYVSAVRIRPAGDRSSFGRVIHVWTMVRRYPEEPGDNGTRWSGPHRIEPWANAVYLYADAMDLAGGKVGHGYGTDVRATRAVVVDQWIAKLDPRARA